MAAKKKRATMLYKLVSSAGSGFFYVGEKSTKQATRKLALRKYDPLVNQYVLFLEQKLKK
jgi:large subunit ribosomal protein L33